MDDNFIFMGCLFFKIRLGREFTFCFIFFDSCSIVGCLYGKYKNAAKISLFTIKLLNQQIKKKASSVKNSIKIIDSQISSQTNNESTSQKLSLNRDYLKSCLGCSRIFIIVRIFERLIRPSMKLFK